MKNRLMENRPYIHFKGRLYYVHKLALDSETREEIVVYQALYPPYGFFTRSLEMFLEEIPERSDNITGQKYRFQLFDGDLNIK